MKFWNNKITAFLAYSNIWVALSVASLTWITQNYFSQFNISYIAFSFFATLAYYGYARFFEGETQIDQNSPITLWHKKYRGLLWFFTISSSLGSIYFLVQLPVSNWIIIGICGAVGLLYPVPYILGQWAGIRHVPGLKLFVIASIWTAITAGLPALHAGELFTQSTWIHLLQRFLFITAITIPFDIRDVQTDHPDIETLPMKFGHKRAKTMILLMGLLIEASLLLQYFQNTIDGWQFVGLFIGVEVAVILSYRSYPLKKDLYYSFLIEGTPILMFLLVYFFKYF